MAEIGRRGLLGLLGSAAVAPFIPVEFRTPKFQPTLFLGSSGLSYGWSDWRSDFGTIASSLKEAQDFSPWEPYVWDTWRENNSVESWSYDG